MCEHAPHKHRPFVTAGTCPVSYACMSIYAQASLLLGIYPHSAHVPPSESLQFFNILSGRFPVRIRKFVLVNAPSMFPLVWKAIKPMMSKDLAGKFTFVTDDTIESLVDKKWLPEELGGSHPQMDVDGFVKGQCAQEGTAYTEIDLAFFDWKKASL